VGLDYVHGYSAREGTRLADQATALTSLLHEGTRYPAGSLVLEAGCGVAAQTVILARNSPDAAFISVDVSAASLAQARRQVRQAGATNVFFQNADIFRLPFGPASFDHVFVYVDASTPGLADGFTRKTFTAMVEAVGPQAVGQGLISPADWASAIRDLGRAAESDGTFCYTFFKAAGLCPGR